MLTVKHKDGMQKIIVGQDARSWRISRAAPADLKAGAAITVPAARQTADGGLETARVNIGRGDFVP